MNHPTRKLAMRISLLHTVPANKDVFEDAAGTLGLQAGDLRHEVRADLREAIQHAGTMSASSKERINRCLLALAAEADAIILTCATLGPAVDGIENFPVPLVRADVALAAAAGEADGRIAVLCAVEGAVEPTRQLFARHAGGATTSVDVILVEGVWALFQSGDSDACMAAIAAATNEAYESGAAVVAYAHPWMAAAADLAGNGHQPLDSPHVALRTVMRRIGA